MGMKRIRDLVVHALNHECSTSKYVRPAHYILKINWVFFKSKIINRCYVIYRGLKLTRETPPGECGRKVKLKGIDGGLYKGWRCGLIRIPRKILPTFVSGLDKFSFRECHSIFLRIWFVR